jgi:predicted transcriptional regulator
MPKRPTNLTLPAELIRSAKTIADQKKTSVSAIVNRLLKDFVARERRRALMAEIAEQEPGAAGDPSPADGSQCAA